MTSPIRYALLIGAAVVLGAGAAAAQMDGPPPGGPGTPTPHHEWHHGHGPAGGRFLKGFDQNKDGKVTKAEVDKVMADRFNKISGGADSFTEAQLAKSYEQKNAERAANRFKRADWNGDGKLSEQEFAAPIRAMFAMRDRDGTGTISCAPRGSKVQGAKAGGMSGHMHRGWHGRRSGGRMCADLDLNKDGKVTRAEVDKATAEKFAANSTNGEMSLAQFTAMDQKRANEMTKRHFDRMDKNKDGKVTLAEFSAREDAMFTRMDKNKDGTITKDEMMQGHGPHGPHRGGQKPQPGNP